MPEKPVAPPDYFGLDDEIPLEPAASPAEEPAEEAAPEPPKFLKEIDLGDGSGVQRFEADTADELIEKLAEAQTSATRKIQELSRKVKRANRRTVVEPAPKPTVQPSVRPLSLEEMADLTLQMSLDPAKAIGRVIEAHVGMTAAELRRMSEDTRSIKSALDEQAAAVEFVSSNEDYVPNPKNDRLLRQYLADEGLSMTAENLQAAFEELKEDGLLTAAKPAEPRIETLPAKPAVPPKAKQTGLPGKKAQPGGSDRLPTADELASLTPEQHRERILSVTHAARAGAAQR